VNEDDIGREVASERKLKQQKTSKMRENVQKREEIMGEKCPFPFPLSIFWKIKRGTRIQEAEGEAERWDKEAGRHHDRICELEYLLKN